MCDNYYEMILCDDHPAIEKSVQVLLRNSAYRFSLTVARDGESSIELAAAIKPDIILMDINLPDISGIEATRRIKNRLPDTIIIGLSLNNEKQIVDAMYKAGAEGYVVKERMYEELIPLVARLLRDRLTLE